MRLITALNLRETKPAEVPRNADGFIVVTSRKKRLRDITDAGSSREEEDLGAPRRAPRVGRPGRFTIKEAS